MAFAVNQVACRLGVCGRREERLSTEHASLRGAQALHRPARPLSLQRLVACGAQDSRTSAMSQDSKPLAPGPDAEAEAEPEPARSLFLSFPSSDRPGKRSKRLDRSDCAGSRRTLKPPRRTTGAFKASEMPDADSVAAM
eukprot:scaffold1574_cov373-Prasinococcus_capsulatus_cf.AAC.12